MAAPLATQAFRQIVCSLGVLEIRMSAGAVTPQGDNTTGNHGSEMAVTPTTASLVSL